MNQPATHNPARRVVATMVTTTSYGTWLPGDLRGYVQDNTILPGEPKLLDHARALLADNPVYFSPAQIIVLDHAIHAAAEEFGYRLTDLSIESWHLHWIIDHGYDPVPDVVGRLKTWMRQMINRGRIMDRRVLPSVFVRRKRIAGGTSLHRTTQGVPGGGW